MSPLAPIEAVALATFLAPAVLSGFFIIRDTFDL